VSDISLRYLLYGQDKGASKAVAGVGTQAQKTSGIIGKSLGGLGNIIGGEVGDVLNQASDGLDKVGESGMSMGAKLQAGGAAIGGIGLALSALGSKDAQAQAQLKSSITATGASWDTYSGQVDDVIHHMENFGRGAADTQNALQTLTTATGSPTKAIQSMGLVANLAAAQHTSLANAGKLVARIYGGSGSRTLKQYGIQMTSLHPTTQQLDAAITQLSNKLQGQAAASVTSFGGHIAVLKNKIGDMAAQVGQKLGPVMTALGPTLMVAGTAMEIVKARQAAAAVATTEETVATEGQTVAQKIAAVAAKGWAAAQWLLNAAMDANPFVLVAALIVALIAVIILAYKHSQTFRDIVHKAFSDVGAIAKKVFTAIATVIGVTFNFIRDHWKLILAILTGPIGAAAIFILSHLQTIRQIFSNVWGAIRSGVQTALGGIRNAITSSLTWISSHVAKMVGWFTGIPGKLSGAFGGMFDGIAAAFRAAIDVVINAWDSLSFHVPSVSILGHKFGGQTISLPHINPLASGGIVRSPTLALVGERGPEAVVPLSRGGGFGNTYHVTTGPMTVDGARELDRVLRNLHSQTGGAMGYSPA
jgi:Flp pilus assembly pilin Flp